MYVNFFEFGERLTGKYTFTERFKRIFLGAVLAKEEEINHHNGEHTR